MAYQPPTSPPTQHIEPFSPVSPHTNMSLDGRRSNQNTPKRRRLAAPDQFAFDNVPPFTIPEVAFDAWSPLEEYREYRHRQPQPPPQSFDAYWEVFNSPWPDMSEPFHPSFTPAPQMERQPPPQINRVSFPPQQSISQMAHFGPPRFPRDFYHPRDPTRPNMMPQTLPVHPNHQASPPTVSSSPPPQPPIRKGAVVLTLSRATKESIEELAEHKRECPACQLDFEPENVLATVECCNTAMHAVCFSAWVNSNNGPGGSRTKTCMKCRKGMDATKRMNAILPPVDGKAWDEGSDFNAPPQLTVGNPVKFDISPLPDAGPRRHRRREPTGYRSRPMAIPENEIFEEYREEFRLMQRDQMLERDRLAVRARAAQNSWSAAFDVEARAAAIATNAKEASDVGGRITQREVEGLVRRSREAKEIQEEAHEEWRSAESELRRLESRNRQAQVHFVQRMHQRRAASSQGGQDSAQAGPTLSEPQGGQ